MRCRKYAIFSQ